MYKLQIRLTEKNLTNVIRTQSMTCTLPKISANRNKVVTKTQAMEIPKLRYSSLSMT